MKDSAEGEMATPYRVADVAKLLDCSEQNIRVMAREGRIPGAFRVSPRMIRFDRQAVDAWIEERKRAGGGG